MFWFDEVLRTVELVAFPFEKPVAVVVVVEVVEEEEEELAVE